MKVKSFVVITLMAMLLISVPAIGFSKEGKGNKCESCEKCGKCDFKDSKKNMHDKMVKDLDLTSAQAEQMKAHRKTQMEQMKQLNKSTKDIQDALRTELDKPNTDMAIIEKLKSDLKNIEAVKIDSRTQGVLDIKKILTPEQFCKMCEKMKQEHKNMKGNRREHRKGEEMNDMPPPPMNDDEPKDNMPLNPPHTQEPM